MNNENRKMKDGMYTEKTDYPSILHLREISQQEFCDHFEDDDFFLAYGNPLVINCDNGKKVVAIAWPLAERMLRDAGRGDEADEVIRRAAEMKDGESDTTDNEEDKRIKYWIYEFEMPEEVKDIIDAYCKQNELTHNEFFEEAVTWYLNKAKSDPEGLKKADEDMKVEGELIRLVRFYPVYKGETEAKALKRKLVEEAEGK